MPELRPLPVRLATRAADGVELAHHFTDDEAAFGDAEVVVVLAVGLVSFDLSRTRYVVMPATSERSTIAATASQVGTSVPFFAFASTIAIVS